MLGFRKGSVDHFEAVVVVHDLLHILFSFHVASEPTTLPMVTIADCPSLQLEVIFANRIAVALMPRLDHHWSQHQALSMGSRTKVALVV